MAFKRSTSSAKPLGGEALTAALVGIGMLFAMESASDPKIEDTLLAASIEGMERDDLRVLAMLMTWLEVHSHWINADRLVRLVSNYPGARVRAFWAAVGHWLSKDRRFVRLIQNYQGAPVDLLATGTAFHLSRVGEDLRFVGGSLRVPAGVLRDRKEDVLSPAELARRHRNYRKRILMGPNYRADMWSELDQDPNLTAAELARRAFSSFGTAWQVKQDWTLLEAAQAH